MLNESFTFDENGFDYWPIYNAIKDYYPLGIPFNPESETFYRSYPGSKERVRLIIDNIHNNEQFEERWGKFQNQIGQELGVAVEGTTNPMAPSFSAALKLENKSIGNMTSGKELHFAVSLLGPFFTIYGIDYAGVALRRDVSWAPDIEDGQVYYHSTCAITTSPYLEYQEHFTWLEQRLRERYSGYRIVPFEISAQIIRGLQVDYGATPLNDISHTVFNGLFHDNHEMNWQLTRGDESYGADDW
jgi:hypothetical protein